MKRLALLFMLFGYMAGSAFIACHRPVTITTAAGQTAYTADQIVVRINELENAAIAANASGSLDVKTTKILVEYSVKADSVLKTTPQGWRATITVAWQQVKAEVPANVNPAVKAAMNAVDLVLAALP